MLVPDLLQPLFGFICPSLCLLCERPVSPDVVVCDACHEDLKRRHGIRGGCFVCGGPINGRQCPRCRKESFAFERVRAPFVYREEVRLLVELYKYGGIVRIAGFLARDMASVLPELGPFDLIVPLPLNKVKERERGFSQTRRLARELERIAGVRMADRLLRRTRNTRSQTGLGREERKLNVRDAFRAEPWTGLEGATVLLVDDVMTTGATMDSAARALKKAGVSRVVAVVAAIVERVG